MAYEEKIIKEVVFQGTETIRDLQDEVKRLRKEVINLDKSSENYEKTVEDLAQAEYNLKINMRATKEGVIAARGSYNDLVDEMAALKRVWRDVTDESERARIGLRIKEINDQLKDLDATLGNNQRKVGSYEEALKKALLTPQQELRNLRKELANLQRGTEEYNNTFIRMAELTTQVRKQQELLRYSSADLGDILGNLAGVAGSVVGGFSAINAAMALMGDESADLQAAMLKAQRMIQLVQGLSSLQNLAPKIQGLFDGIKNFVKGFRGGVVAVGDFNKALQETDGAATKTTAELNTQAKTLSSNAAAAQEQATANEKLTTSYNGLRVAIDEINKSYGIEINQIKESNLAEEEKIKQIDRLKQARNEARHAANEQFKAETKLSAAEASEKLQNRALEKQITKTNNVFKLYRQSVKGAEQGTVQYTAASKGAAIASKVLVGALQAVKVAMAAIGIGILIAGLTALLGLIGKGITKLYNWATGAKAVADATNAVKQATEDLNRTLEENNEMMDFQSRLMEAQGAEYEEVYEYKKQQITANLALARAELAESEALEANTRKNIFNRKARKELTEAINEQRQSVTDLEKELRKLDQERTIHLAQEETNKRNQNKGGGGSYNSELKAAENLYKQLANWYKTDRQLLAQTYEENKKTIEKYIKDKKAKNDALLALEQKYYADLKKLTKDNMEAIYSVYMNQENRKLALMDVWGDKYLERALEVLDEEEKIAKGYAAKKVGFEEKTQEQIARMDAATKKEYLEKEKLFRNEVWLIEREYSRKERELREEYNTRLIEEGRRAIEIKKENAKTDEELHEIEIELAEYDLANVFQKEGESANEYQLRVIALVKALEALQKKEEEIAVESKDWTQLGLDNDATEAGIKHGKDSMQYYDARIKAAQYYYDNLKQLQEESNEEFRQRQLEALDELTELERAKLEQRFTNWSNLANGIGDIFGAIADMYQTDIQAQKDADGKYNAQSKKKFEWVKRLQIAQATIQTISGAISAFMSAQSLGFPLGQIIGAVQAAAVTAAGIAQIHQIRKTKLDGSSDVGNTRYAVATPSITDYNPQGVTNLTGGSETEELANALTKNPVKAYVVESDVTAAQEVAAKRRNEATF